LHSLNRKKVDALVHSDYDKAQVYEDAMQSILEHESRELTGMLSDRDRASADFRRETIKQKLQTQTQELNNAIQSNQAEEAQKLQQLESVHNQEIAEFKARWRSAEWLKQFARPSPQMLQMRHVEKKLALQKRYGDAKKMKELTDRRQCLEEDLLKKHVESQLKLDYQKLMERHQSEVDRLETFYGMSNLKLELKLRKTVRGLEIALKQSEVPRLELAMVKRRKARTLASTTAPQNAVLTPRTQKVYAQFRTGRNADLRLPAVDDIITALPAPRSRSRLTALSVSRQSASG
jgi:hypothetical protein